MLRFIKPDEKRAPEYLKLCREYEAENNLRHGNIDTIEKATERINQDINCEKDIIPIEDELTITWWVENENGELVGTCRLRPELQNLSVNVDGHIGYDVGPEYRKKGYGTEILRLALKKSKKFGIKDVLVTCADDNAASCRIIEKNGGIFEKTIFDEEDQEDVRRYWIRNK